MNKDFIFLLRYLLDSMKEREKKHIMDKVEKRHEEKQRNLDVYKEKLTKQALERKAREQITATKTVIENEDRDTNVLNAEVVNGNCFECDKHGTDCSISDDIDTQINSGAADEDALATQANGCIITEITQSQQLREALKSTLLSGNDESCLRESSPLRTNSPVDGIPELISSRQIIHNGKNPELGAEADGISQEDDDHFTWQPDLCNDDDDLDNDQLVQAALLDSYHSSFTEMDGSIEKNRKRKSDCEPDHSETFEHLKSARESSHNSCDSRNSLPDVCFASPANTCDTSVNTTLPNLISRAVVGSPALASTTGSTSPASDDTSDSGISIQDDLAHSNIDTTSTVGGVTEEEDMEDEEENEEATEGHLSEEPQSSVMEDEEAMEVDDMELIEDDSQDYSTADDSQATLVEKIFGGKTVRLTHCLNCQTISEIFDNFFDFKLSFEDCTRDSRDIVGLDGLIRHTLKKQDLVGSEQYYCEVCEGKQDAEIHTAVVKAPEFLILSQNRFIYDSVEKQESKIMTRVEFEEELQLPVWKLSELRRCVSAPRSYVVSDFTLNASSNFSSATQVLSSNSTVDTSTSMKNNTENTLELESLGDEYMYEDEPSSSVPQTVVYGSKPCSVTEPLLNNVSSSKPCSVTESSLNNVSISKPFSVTESSLNNVSISKPCSVTESSLNNVSSLCNPESQTEDQGYTPDTPPHSPDKHASKSSGTNKKGFWSVNSSTVCTSSSEVASSSPEDNTLLIINKTLNTKFPLNDISNNDKIFDPNNSLNLPFNTKHSSSLRSVNNSSNCINESLELPRSCHSMAGFTITSALQSSSNSLSSENSTLRCNEKECYSNSVFPTELDATNSHAIHSDLSSNVSSGNVESSFAVPSGVEEPNSIDEDWHMNGSENVAAVFCSSVNSEAIDSNIEEADLSCSGINQSNTDLNTDKELNVDINKSVDNFTDSALNSSTGFSSLGLNNSYLCTTSGSCNPGMAFEIHSSKRQEVAAEDTGDTGISLTSLSGSQVIVDGPQTFHQEYFAGKTPTIINSGVLDILPINPSNPVVKQVTDSDSLQGDCKRERYALYGVVVHSGKMSRSGHYYCYARSSTDAVRAARSSPQHGSDDHHCYMNKINIRTLVPPFDLLQH